MKRTADRLFGDAYRWSVLGAGRHQTNLVTIGGDHGRQRARRAGGQHLSGARASSPSNAEQVARSSASSSELSLEVATPDEAREMLALKGPDATKIPYGRT